MTRALGSLLSLLVIAALAPAARAQNSRATPKPVLDSTPSVHDPALKALRWRGVGPFRGGRAVAVAGDPVHARTFYFGAVDGGVWKTVNGGQSWHNITDLRSDIASVGAIAVAPSDPNVIYVGTGEADFREDLTSGTGMYRSTDAGESWTHIGLDDSRHIANIQIDPANPEVAYVAAFGHAFGPNSTRGVYRTRDGGKSWTRVLFLNDSTGAIDLALDPTNSRILYASMWRFQRYPWGFSSGAGRSGLWKSTDSGDTWTELTFNPGLPDTVGRIGITISPVHHERLWAVVESVDSSGGIFRSGDAGKTWERVNGDQTWKVRPWYYSLIFADPQDEHTVYALNLSTWKSIDDGAHFNTMRVPHGDDHNLWIDPRDGKRMIEGNDGGAVISFDGGVTWSSNGNQPTAQFYHVTTDNQFPYRIYGAQQDNSPVSVPSRSAAGVIRDHDWWTIGGGEAGYVAVDPTDPNVTFTGDYMGTIIRDDHRMEQRRDVSVFQNNYDGIAVRDVPYRFQWTFPILFSPHDPKTLFITAQMVLKSTNAGQSWTRISPDLTLHDSATMGPVGGPVTHDMTGTEWYATVFAFAESPRTAGEYWAGSDDGLVHLSRDAGATWQDVTPKGLARFTRMSIIEPSHFDPAVAYVAANRYQQDDFHPYLLKTADYGKSWTRITTGIPDGAYTRSIREDPVRRGLLYAGTETGIYVSFDDGGHWQSLQLNLPRSSVRDITIHGSDVIVATHGRSFWVLDDVAILRQLSDSIRRASEHLFPPEPAVRVAGGHVSTTQAGENPPDGVIVDYWLKEKPKGEVSLTFLDRAGKVIRTFKSKPPKDSAGGARDAGARGDSAGKARAPRRGAADSLAARDTTARSRRGIEQDSMSFAPSDSVVASRAGMNRFVWNLSYPGVKFLKGIVLDEGTYDGPIAVPGVYSVRLAVDGRTLTQPFTVTEDPRVRATQQDLEAQFALATQVHDAIDTLTTAALHIEDMERQLDDRVSQTKDAPFASRVSTAAKALRPKLESVRATLEEVNSHVDEITLVYPVKIYNQLLTLNAMVQTADAAPTEGELGAFKDLADRLQRQLSILQALESGDVAAFNRLLRELDVPAVGAPKASAVP